MSRRYDDPVDVRRRGDGSGDGSSDVPAQFLWRGRLYVVRDVLAHWVEVGAWWRGASASALIGTETGPDSAAPAAGGTASVVTAGGGSTVAVDLDGPEREVWRVEASAGRARGTGVYDLCLDASTGTWTLARAID